MSEMMLFDMYEEGNNPYGVAPINNVMAEARRHESGNAVAANAEARAVAEVKAQVLMAKQFPRSPQASMENILRECERPSLADQATYSFPRGKETVTGPSIRLAEMMARNWGNCNFGVDTLERKTTGKTGYSILRAFAWDMETNTYISRQFEVKHIRETKSGSYPLTSDRDIYELEANMGARRVRACILQMLPGDVTQAALDKCRIVSGDRLNEGMKDPRQRMRLITKTVSIFEKMGISSDDMEAYLNCKREDWTADHMLKVKELKNSLDDGAVQIGDVFPHLAGNMSDTLISKEQVEELMSLIAATKQQGAISKELKKLGISKVANTPIVRLEEVKALIEAYTPSVLPNPDVDPETGEVASSDA